MGLVSAAQAAADAIGAVTVQLVQLHAMASKTPAVAHPGGGAAAGAAPAGKTSGPPPPGATPHDATFADALRRGMHPETLAALEARLERTFVRK